MTQFANLMGQQLFTPQPQGSATMQGTPAYQYAQDQAPKPAPAYQAPALGSIDPTTGQPWAKPATSTPAPAVSPLAMQMYANTNGNIYGTYTNGQTYTGGYNPNATTSGG